MLSILKGEALIRYFRRQMWEAATTTPRLPDQSDEDHFESCLRWADQHGKTAREKGGDFHDMIQQFHLSCIAERPVPAIPSIYIDQFDVYSRWYETYVDKTLTVEATVIGQGYAGRLDHCALLKDGRVAVLDVKTQDISKRNRFNYYSEWGLQLGAYAGALEPVQHVDCLISIVVSSSFPVVLEAHYWPNPPAYYHGLFLGLLRVWNEMHNYWPEPMPLAAGNNTASSLWHPRAGPPP